MERFVVNVTVRAITLGTHAEKMITFMVSKAEVQARLALASEFRTRYLY